MALLKMLILLSSMNFHIALSIFVKSITNLPPRNLSYVANHVHNMSDITIAAMGLTFIFNLMPLK